MRDTGFRANGLAPCANGAPVHDGTLATVEAVLAMCGSPGRDRLLFYRGGHDGFDCSNA
ncbi:hypothetical protein MSIMFB_02524 [Mycobacterium simulans]|uniref:Uncharacterized protein n=1 Tax=Mycobacterium simulans TaxID=627089 RepID=A0A7Z7ILT2_9MYCO|nr:hypothetical protein MSIMFB_02524 [Mycobacterium simulans]